MIRYAITSGVVRLGNAADYIQVRARELSGSALKRLTLDILHAAAPGVRVLVNDRADIAIACGCAGVHLRSDSISPVEIRRIAPEGFVISVSCHSIDDVVRADAEGADLALLSPIFASPGKGEPLGLDYLTVAAHAVRIPVLALGAVTFENAAQCVAAGARGVAGIRMFAP